MRAFGSTVLEKRGLEFGWHVAIGWHVAVDFEPDADFNQNWRRPGHAFLLLTFPTKNSVEGPGTAIQYDMRRLGAGIAVNIAKLPEPLTRRRGLSGLQHLTRLGVDEMNPPASGTRHGLVDFPIGQVIGSPALHQLAASWATVCEWDH